MTVPVRTVVILLFCLAVLTSCSKEQPAQQLSASGYAVENAFPRLSFSDPVGLVEAPDGSVHMFVLERSGRIIVFQASADSDTSSVFLDIRGKVTSEGGEEGLLGLAFHPDFRTNGYFYVDYTAPNPLHTVISRFTVNAADPTKADPASESVLLEVQQPAANHNGGQLQFGPEGYLYIGLGDGGFAGDPGNRAQNLNTLLGKILRIDVDHPSGEYAYGIPIDNPFTGPAQRHEIWAYGLRNPWRFSFDPVTHRLWAADVGQDAIEEVDIIDKGLNYGWNIMEGDQCYNPASRCDQTGLVKPVWQYTHSLGSSVTGGYVYRGTRVPSLVGHYVCADYGSGRIWALTYDGSGPANAVEMMRTGLAITSFGVDAAGEIYFCASDGKVYRIKEIQS